MPEFAEKRKHPRIDVSVPVRYKELKSNQEKAIRSTRTKNLSINGARFSTDKFLSLASRLVVEMQLPTLSRPIKAISKIAWIKKLPTGDGFEVGTQFEIGNQFLDMAKEDKKAITEYAQSIIDSNPFNNNQ